MRISITGMETARNLRSIEVLNARDDVRPIFGRQRHEAIRGPQSGGTAPQKLVHP